MAKLEMRATKRTPDWSPAAHEPDGSLGGGSRGVERLQEYQRLRRGCPVAWTEDYGGYWTLTKYDEVKAAALHYKELRSGRPFMQLPDFSEASPLIPLGLNPPEHTRFRRSLNTYFGPDRMDALEPLARAHVTERLDSILRHGSGEMISEFCRPVAARVLASLLNLPDDAWQELLGQQAELAEARKSDPAEVDRLSFELFARHVHRLVQDRRAHPRDPETDVFSGILALQVDGKPIDDATVVGIGVVFLGAGHPTTADGIAGSLHLLATNPGDQSRLRDDPSLIPSAVEEFLRLDTPSHEHCRRAAEQTQIGDRTIEAGEYVALNWASANRDEDEFPHPTACLIDREPNRHLAFGHGVHKCLGAPLARLEIRVALEEVLRRTRSFDLAGAPDLGETSHMGGFGALPLRFNLS